ncbi:MutS_V domain-containing protein/Smr domain-containing protein [Cephalotus follicularis]|uniref:MutS_V domain-containing protein/Smr domain-containing protein n=1 Tax=Cephalotus follicularis TaxID=3775 RepID=A0A1Q3CCH1_CEPFO|nr:MutS_V domain-containing protein/Smr domain-containing protein [Cephalotus follicularis]
MVTIPILSLQKPLILHHHHRHTLDTKLYIPKLSLSLNNSPRLPLSQSLQSETLEILEWNSLCNQLSAFASTSMGRSATRNARIPVGQTLQESQKLLNQTAAAMEIMKMIGNTESLNLSKIEDVSGILNSAISGELLTVGELCTVRRMLRTARELRDKLEAAAANLGGDCTDRYSPLLDILENCDFQMELEQKIGFCMDCNLSIILDRASEDLEIVRSERKRNMENLDSLLRRVSGRILQAGGIDNPLITRRRSRLCVGVRASHKHLLSGGVILNVSSSGVTYFMEPKEAVELNNMEVRLSNSEKAEEKAILSLLTSEISKLQSEIKHLSERLLDVELAFARASYAQWMNGVCPTLSSKRCEGLDSSGPYNELSVDIEGIRHPLLLESSRRISLDEEYRVVADGTLLEGVSDFPVPIDIKVECGTRVVVISGPNTGGKTASMKTLGLASLMSKAGMYLPAKNNPRLPWFDLVLADIGDPQSLEQNLSTFSGRISRLCKILEVCSNESLVLIDEIGSGTDPSEGVALSASILQYLSDRVHLAVVTTHYTDLSLLKDKDNRFKNAAMEFSLETLQPTYRILWGSSGDSNALDIAKSIGFDSDIIERAHKWMEKLMPEKQQQRMGLLYQSLEEERNGLESQLHRAKSLHAEIMDVYHEIQDEAEDLDGRGRALMAKETQQVQEELKAAKSQIETVVQEFEKQLNTASTDEYNSLIKKAESAIASIIKAHQPSDSSALSETDGGSYVPKLGEQVHVKGLGDKLATVVEVPGNDETVLVQYGKIKVRVKKSNIRAIRSSKKNVATNSVPYIKRKGRKSQEFQSPPANKGEQVSYGPLVQTSKNSVDLRGMRVEEAARHLDMEISAREPQSLLFIIHGMGTGAVKECALEILRNHPRVAKYEQENPMNYGCTVAYIK